MNENGPLLPHRAGHLFVAVMTSFMGSYHLWIAANGLYSGEIWLFTKTAAQQVSSNIEPGWFWATLAGRLVFGTMLLSVAVACLLKARKSPSG